jgi:hypothetical protein
MRTPDPHAHVARARSHLNRALSEWDAADPRAREAACESLESTIGELQDARQSLALGGYDRDPELRRGMREIQKSAAGLAGLVNASAAFWRGMSLRTGYSAAVGDAGAAADSRELGRA